MEKLDTWHDRLAYAMRKRNVKGKQLAEATQNTPASVSDWISGKTKMMGGDNAVLACTFLRINQQWLFFGKGNSGLDLVVKEPELVYQNPIPEEERWPLKGISPNRWASLKSLQKKTIIDWVDDQITSYTGVENPNKRAAN